MPFADDFAVTVFVDEDVDPTGTPDLDAANLNYHQNATKELYTALSALYTSHESLESDVAALSGGYEDTTFKTGLKLEWISTTQIRVVSGACYVPGASIVAEATGNTTITPSGLVASTWYYVYGLNLGGVLSYAVSSADAPVQYRGVAKHRNNNASQRYIGSFRTNSSSQIMAFSKYDNGWTEWQVPTWVSGSPLLVLSGGNSTSPTNISCSNAVPSLCKLARFFVYHETNLGVYFSNSEANYTLSTSSGQYYYVSWKDYDGQAGSEQIVLPLDSSRQFNYRVGSSIATTASRPDVVCVGYYEET